MQQAAPVLSAKRAQGADAAARADDLTLLLVHEPSGAYIDLQHEWLQATCLTRRCRAARCWPIQG